MQSCGRPWGGGGTAPLFLKLVILDEVTTYFYASATLSLEKENAVPVG